MVKNRYVWRQVGKVRLLHYRDRSIVDRPSAGTEMKRNQKAARPVSGQKAETITRVNPQGRGLVSSYIGGGHRY